MIEVNSLIKTFKNGAVDTLVLKSLSFSVPNGQFLSITGKSGSGKSTLLYQLSLLDPPTSGSIKYNGQDVTNLSSKKRTQFRLHQLGFVFQDYALIPTLTATENVMIPLLMLGLDTKSATNKAHEALTKVGLADRYDNLPSMLSGGQQQRVSIARAIGHTPEILFADEPTANLDSETSETVLQAFLELHKQGQTIIMVTHELEYAQLTERIITLADGNIVSDKKVMVI